MKKTIVILLGVTLLFGCSNDKENEPDVDDAVQESKETKSAAAEDDDGKKEYESIFVKSDNHLKVIKLDDDNMIFNDIINE